MLTCVNMAPGCRSGLSARIGCDWGKAEKLGSFRVFAARDPIPTLVKALDDGGGALGDGTLVAPDSADLRS
jgi:hypothetical protein